jgi:outer membrane protein assembly factor BamB
VLALTLASRALRAIAAALWPVLAAVACFGWLHALHTWRVRDQAPLAPIVLQFIPLLLLDQWLGARFAGRTLRGHLSDPGGRWTALRDMLIWCAGFGVWVVLIGAWSQTAQWLRWFGPDFYLQLWLVFRAEGWLTWLAAALWAAAYLVATVRGRGLRLETSLALPVVLSGVLFAHLTFGGGLGALSIAEIVEQPGVSLRLDPRTLHVEGDAPTPLHEGPVLSCSSAGRPPKVTREVPYRWHPRDVIPTPDALIVSYGCSFCLETGLTPTVLRIPRSHGPPSCFRSGNLHHIDVIADRGRVWAAPWTTRDLYALKLDDLSVDYTLASPKRGEMRFFQPIQIVEDVNGAALYAGTELESTLVRFDLKERRYDRQLRLADEGLVEWGGPLHFIEQHPTTRRLYFTSGPGHNLFEVDPDSMTVLRSMPLDDVVGTALLLDPEAGTIYYQSGVRDALFEIDLASWRVMRTFDGEIHARRLALDRERRALYVLGHLSGRVLALDLVSGERRWTRDVGGRPHGLALDGDQLWVNSFAGLFRLHLPTIWGEPGSTQGATP